MATDTDTSLILSISADIRQMQRALKKMESDTTRSTRAVEKQFDDMGKNVDRSVSKLGSSLTSALKNFGGGLAGGLAGAFGAQQFTQFADGATRITNALKVAGLEGKNLSDTYQRLGKIALANGASFEAVATLYAKVTANAKQLGITSQQAEEFTRRIAVGLRASGTDAQAASAGILQLNQALASGVLRGDEFNSVAENLPVVAKAIADGMGVTVGKLRELAAEGALDAKTVFDAFIRGSDGLDAQAAKTSATFSQSFENISTALTIAVGKFNETTGASQGFADAVTNFVAPAIVDLGNSIAETNRRHNALARDLDNFFKDTGIEQGAKNIIDAIRDLGRAADPLVKGFQDAQEQIRTTRAALASDLSGIADDYDAAMASLRETGQTGVAAGIEAEFEKLNQKVKDGTFTVQDFDTVIAKLVDTGDATADSLAGDLELIQAKFVKAGDAAKKSFDDAGKALADALGGKALATVDALVARFSSAMPDAVGRFTSALREAVAVMGQMDAASATIVGQLASGGGFQPGDLNKGPGAGFLNFGDLSFERDMTAAGDSMAAGFIKKFEGFISKAKYDVNAFRVGFGSDTTTRSGGVIEKVTKDTIVTLDDAERDLTRRIVEFQSGIKTAIGVETWKSLSEAQQAALTSIAYNYGSLPKSIVAAIESGSGPESVARAIAGLSANPGRRKEEAQAYLSGTGFSLSDAGIGASKKRSPTDLFQGDMDQIQRRIDLLNAEYEAQSKVNPLINDYGFAVDKARIQQQLLNEAKQAGVTITPELSAKIEQLATNYAKASSSAEQLAETQKNAAQASQEWGQLASTALNSITSALQDGKITAEEWLQIGVQIIQQLLQMKSIAGGAGGGGGLFGGLLGGGSGGGAGGLLGGLIIPGILHKGGTAGIDGYNHNRVGLASDFAGARRYHMGGIAGKRPGEIPAYLEPGEVVIPNGGGFRAWGNQPMGIADVRVYMDDNGKWQAEVERISEGKAMSVTRAGIIQHDKDINKSFGARMANAQARQL